MHKFHFGIVIYNNPVNEIARLCNSIKEACKFADVKFDISLLFNSPDPIDLPTNLYSTRLEYSDNLGFGGGHNKIVDQYPNDTSYYVGLNPDGFLLLDAVKNALGHISEKDVLYEFLQFPEEHPKVYDAKTGITPWCSGAAFMIKTSLFKKLGGFDDRFFMYCEDVDLSWRILLGGGHCICMGNARFFHDVSDGRSTDQTMRNMLASQVLLAEKWGSTRSRLRAKRRLKIICRRSGLPMPAVSTIERISSDGPPDFCDFSHGGSYGATRW